jgi:hypothetical protein
MELSKVHNYCEQASVKELQKTQKELNSVIEEGTGSAMTYATLSVVEEYLALKEFFG